MLPLEELLRILDGMRSEAIGLVESPPEGMRNEFGFGRVSGMIQMLAQIRNSVLTQIEENDRKNNKED